MRIKIKIVGLISVLIFLSSGSSVFAQAYNPLVKGLLKNADQTLHDVQTYKPSEGEKCAKTEWDSFSRSFLSYENFISDWSDLFGPNDCLREDIWALEDKLQSVSKIGLMEVEKCNDNVEQIKALYTDLNNHITGLRLYGENQELENQENQNCPNCRKAQHVGKNNVGVQYYSQTYTKEGCVLTQKNSEKSDAQIAQLKDSIKLFSNMKALLEENDFSAGFTAEDRTQAQKNATSWWGNTWNNVYGQKSRQLSFRHLRDGEDNMFKQTIAGTLAKDVISATASIFLPPTVGELVDNYSLQLEVYQMLSYNQEQLLIAEDLAAWQSELGVKYTRSRDVEDDLENYLIAWNNSIKTLVDTKNPVIWLYFEKLSNIASNHCKNLYGSCK